MISGKSLYMMNGLLLLLLLFFVLPINSSAQVIPKIEIPSSFNPVGSGARALGMGGALIAIADDATAASWNPGGLIQLETPEISVVGAFVSRTENNFFGESYDAEDEQTNSYENINYLSAAYPFTALNRNMIVSVSHQYLYDFTRTLDYPVEIDSATFEYSGNAEVNHEGGLSAIGIAYCLQATPAFSLGFTLNFWQDGLYSNELKSEWNEEGTGIANGNPFTFNATSYDELSYRGYNFNIGILWNATNHLSVGLVFKSPLTMDVDYISKRDIEYIFPNNPTLNIDQPLEDEYNAELDMPMSYGIGLAYRFSDLITASLDIYRTEWQDFILITEDGEKISPITGTPDEDVETESTNQLRTGIEYLYISNPYVIPIRGGLFYDPAPTDGGVDDFFGFSCGTGLSRGGVVFDIAYQYRFANNIAEYILKNWDFSQDVSEHTVYASIIYHF